MRHECCSLCVFFLSVYVSSLDDVGFAHWHTLNLSLYVAFSVASMFPKTVEKKETLVIKELREFAGEKVLKRYRNRHILHLSC